MPNTPLRKLQKLHAEAQALLEGKEEALREEEPLAQRPFWIRFCARVHRSFIQNRGPVRAAALAYTTVLAFVPLLAIAVSVSTSLLKREGEEPIQQLINGFVRYVAPALDLTAQAGPAPSDIAQESVVNRKRVVNEITGFVQRFRSGTLGASGVLALIFVAISLLSTIEATFNDMWGVREGRTWARRVVLYWTGLTLGPLLLVAAVGLTGASQLRTDASGLYLFLLPCLVLGLSLSLLYLLMPNAKVEWRAALVGGLVAASLLQANSALSVIYLSRVVTYRDIYGTLASVPLFLLGLYVAWVIVLLGGQVAHAYQTRGTYMEDRKADKVNQWSREFVALRLMTEIGRRFREANSPPDARMLAESVKVSEKLVHQVLTTLVQDKLLVEVSGRPIGYGPARPLEAITAGDILRALRVGSGREMAMGDDGASRTIREEIDSIAQAEQQVAGALTLRDLVDRIAKIPSQS
ncbi:MAG: YihY family inner membrane protein [Verrucomicrobia bacterium]|nr:YihY family inner membrane protein [Verrucomicrobiota bacterium]